MVTRNVESSDEMSLGTKSQTKHPLIPVVSFCVRKVLENWLPLVYSDLL